MRAVSIDFSFSSTRAPTAATHPHFCQLWFCSFVSRRQLCASDLHQSAHKELQKEQSVCEAATATAQTRCSCMHNRAGEGPGQTERRRRNRAEVNTHSHCLTIKPSLDSSNPLGPVVTYECVYTGGHLCFLSVGGPISVSYLIGQWICGASRGSY